MTDEKGFYRHKCYKDYMVCVYDVSFCEKNNLWYYSYIDLMLDSRRLSRAKDNRRLSCTKDKFLDKFEFIDEL